MRQYGFFDEENILADLSKLGNPLEKTDKVVDWEMFRPILEEAFRKVNPGVGGRPPWDYVLMLKVLLLGQWHGLSDDKLEYQIRDRVSFRSFLGLNMSSNVPDSKTIWLFRDNLGKSGYDRKIFDMFVSHLGALGLIVNAGKIVDSQIVEAPRQRNTREENAEIKAGKVPQEWLEPENVYKRRQKDCDATWTKKNNETYYGYKNNLAVDSDSKLITNCIVTTASVHDSQVLEQLVEKEDKAKALFCDSAYTGKDLRKAIKEKAPKMKLRINEKGYRNRPLTARQKAANRRKSKVRARVEHVFGFMHTSMEGVFLRGIGIVRATTSLLFKNLAYNISRFAYLSRINWSPNKISA